MFAIFESNGGVPMGLVCKEDGSGVEQLFNTKEEAKAYADKNCAFDYQIIVL
jgi:hypothetical protein